MKFKINKSITPLQVKQLISFSNLDPQSKKFTTDQQRFQNLKAYHFWRRKKRTIFCLTDKQGNLAGIIWFGRKKLPLKSLPVFKYPFTLSVRLYPPARGRGLAKNFISFTWKNYCSKPIYQKSKYKNFWIITSLDNQPIIKIFKKLGFTRSKNKINNKIIMLYSPQKL